MDARLPLLRINERSLRSFDLCPSDNNEAISFINGWDDLHIELFEKEQWGILAPFFSSKTEEKDGVRHYKFSSRERLPFQLVDDQTGMNANRTTKTSDTVNSMSSEASEVIEPMKGAHGRVWRVKIDKAHHDLPSYRAKLFRSNRNVFNNEVLILKKLNKFNCSHLVKLILTMEVCVNPNESKFFLVFPLADCNLTQFWNTNFPHPKGANTAAYARWVAQQCYGLADALGKLHDTRQHQVEGPQKEADGSQGGSSDPSYGIHGDIKPDNLLWYRNWVDSASQAPQDIWGSLGVIQLADFGITRLHHTDTKSNVDKIRGTKTYAPPEVEWAVSGFSRSFDIWSLGCVFLELVCWLVQGGSGTKNPVEAFHQRRYLQGKNISLQNTKQDTFYTLEKKQHETRSVPRVNPAVVEVWFARAHCFVANTSLPD
ncbi:kinase-like domain-containing protein [Corynascus novoguineensis]|uniref:Kinase-like domain-containing protein n=1 Tax=Corynascus novoguineensis TaxID=1126955 RepID=A0AAN7CRN6_9PEZI|nr:kinase-like domain-containing protein [Corynascus novoguineensis]